MSNPSDLNARFKSMMEFTAPPAAPAPSIDNPSSSSTVNPDPMLTPSRPTASPADEASAYMSTVLPQALVPITESVGKSSAWGVKDDPFNCVSLFLLDSVVGQRYCCGVIGTGGERFCTRLVVESGRCGTVSHNKKAKIESNHYFIQAPDVGRTVYSAYLEPSIERGIAESKLAPFLKDRQTVQVWNRMFESSLNMKPIESQEDAKDFKARANSELPKGVTPMKRKYEKNVVDASVVELPEIKFTKAKIEFEEKATFEENAAFLGSILVDDVEAIATSLPQLSGQISSLIMDVKTLDLNLSSLITDIGTDPGIAEGIPFSTVWRAIQYAAKLADVGLVKIRDLEKIIKDIQGPEQNKILKDITDAKLEASEAESKGRNALKLAQQAQTEYSNLRNEFVTFRNFISTEIPKALKILMDGHNVASGSTNRPCGLIFDRLNEVERKTKIIIKQLPLGNNTTSSASNQQAPAWEGGFANIFGNSNSATASNSTTIQTSNLHASAGGQQPPNNFNNSNSEIYEIVTKLQNQLNGLEDRVKSDSVTIAGYTFGSFSETLEFVKEHVPNGISDGFHDIVTLLERCTDHYVDYAEGMSTQSQSSKAGYDSVEEGKNAYSYEIILPGVFGRRKSGSKESEFQLPACPTHNGWDPRDGQTGLETRVSTQMSHLQVSLDRYIDRTYGSHAANKLAHSLLTQSCSFWNAFCKWVGSDYARFTNMSGCTTSEGWILVSACVYVMFEELYKVRMHAASAKSESDVHVRCATYLWCTLQAHRVMRDFNMASFRGHPSIGPIINLHLFQYRVPTSVHDKALTRITELEKLVATLKKNQDSMSTKISKLK